MVAVKNTYQEQEMDIYWENLADSVCSSFSFADEERCKFLSNKAAKLIGCLPKIAGTKTPERDGCSNLAVYIMSIRATKQLYNHQECDDSDIFARLHDIMNFNGGDHGLINKGMTLLALMMVNDYKRDIEPDTLEGKYNPVASGAWDFNSVRSNLIAEYKKIDSQEIDTLLTLSETGVLFWEK
ncbi:MAG: hypothetical protein KAQ69_00085 [Spirochaetales bacterium]|nr:hypothetical protein [Spirochaetales bacterium]